MKAIVYTGQEPKVVEDGQQKYLLYPEGCRVRVIDLARLEVPGGRFVGTEEFWEAVARVTGIVYTDTRIFRGNNGYGTQDLVMRLAAALGFAVYIPKEGSRYGAATEAGEGETVQA